MASAPTRRTGPLDLAAVIGLAGPVVMLLYSFDRRPPWIIASVAALVVAAIVVWVLWRRSGQHSRIAAAAFAVIATATLALGDGSLYYGVVWAACLVLGLTFASAAALWSYIAALVVLVTGLHVFGGSGLERTVTEAVGTAVVAALAAAVAGVLRDSIRVGRELEDALVRLGEANAELQRRLDAEGDLVLARERERTARELHDGLGHRLTAIGLAIDYAEHVDDPESALTELRRARHLVTESLDAMRRTVRAMHPVELGSMRDAGALRAVADAFRGTGVDLRVRVDDMPLPHDHALFLLRFVQEGLTNVVRHSDASAVDLSVTEGDGRIEAVILDLGGRRAPDAEEGFGLRSLRSRAASLGGRLEAAPTPSGFRLAVSLPAPTGAATR
jgi:signal transduction histidine kinase